MFILSYLPFSIKYVNGHRYYYIFFNNIKYFNSSLLIVFAVSSLLKIIYFGFSNTSILSWDKKASVDNIYDLIFICPSLFCAFYRTNNKRGRATFLILKSCLSPFTLYYPSGFSEILVNNFKISNLFLVNILIACQRKLRYR